LELPIFSRSPISAMCGYLLRHNLSVHFIRSLAPSTSRSVAQAKNMITLQMEKERSVRSLYSHGQETIIQEKVTRLIESSGPPALICSSVPGESGHDGCIVYSFRSGCAHHADVP
jgi:hypothetical protein